MLTVYGLKKCSTCREATAFPKDKGIEHRFIDVRGEGIDEASVGRFAGAMGPDRLLNRRGLMWRHIPAGQRTGLDEAKSIALMVRYPALIRRPVVERDGVIKVGLTLEIGAWLTD